MVPDIVQNFPIFVINLERSRERRIVMMDHLTDLSLDFDLIQAVDGTALNAESAELYSSAKSQETIGRELLPGEVGCALSHYLIYRRMLDQSIDTALIIEDDVALSREMVDVLRIAMERYPDWDLVNLITDVDEELLEDRPLAGPYTLTSFMQMPNRTGAYLLRLSGARKLVDTAIPVRMAADTLTGNSVLTGLVLRGVFPPLATLRPTKSTFQRGNYPPKSIVWERKVPVNAVPSLVTLNPVLIPSKAWVAWHTIRSYLGPIKRWIFRLLRMKSSRN